MLLRSASTGNMVSYFRTISGVCECTAALHTEKFQPTRITILTVLHGIERIVACPAVWLPSPSGQEMLLVYFGIPLFYPPYTDRTATCAPPPCRQIDRHVLTQRLCSLLWPPWYNAWLEIRGFSHYSYGHHLGFEHLFFICMRGVQYVGIPHFIIVK